MDHENHCHIELFLDIRNLIHRDGSTRITLLATTSATLRNVACKVLSDDVRRKQYITDLKDGRELHVLV